MKHKLYFLPLILLLMLTYSACEKDEVTKPDDNEEEKEQQQDPQTNSLNVAFYDLMQEWYLWYDQMPEIKPDSFSNPSSLLKAIRYKEDIWSYITTFQAFTQYYEQGAYIGYGFSYRWDETDSLRITFVFEDSPLAEENIQRGWVITRINGNEIQPADNINDILGNDEIGVENTFEFSKNGHTVTSTFAKEEISMNTVLMDTVLQANDKQVGYFVLKSFINKTPDELKAVFEDFASKKIDELVVDLRYNGGGTLQGSRILAEYILNDEDMGKTFVKISHNDKKTEEDSLHVFSEDPLNISLGLERVYFITTQATASASEALINGLDPYLDVKLIGQATYGKPVGMYAFSDNNQQFAFVPVCFELENAAGVADYYDGLPVDVATEDDITEPFGSSQEKSLYQALYHIENGSFDQRKAGYRMIPENKVEYRSLEDEIGAQ